MFSPRFSAFTTIALLLLAGAHCADAVCPSGQMAVGTEINLKRSGSVGLVVPEYSGFLMANNCGIISHNGATKDSQQMCQGGYQHGASVSCSGGRPVSAVDTKGQHWKCSTTSDKSCNKGSGTSVYTVKACCTRN